MFGISFSAPTAWRLSESRASRPVTTVDRSIRTPDPPVHVAVASWAGQDQADRGLALLEGQEFQELVAASGPTSSGPNGPGAVRGERITPVCCPPRI
jgi:hypothetical protein